MFVISLQGVCQATGGMPASWVNVVSSASNATGDVGPFATKGGRTDQSSLRTVRHAVTSFAASAATATVRSRSALVWASDTKRIS